MKIEFINHASVIFSCGPTKILTDPWYCGSAFDKGWDLLVEKDIDINSLDFNYIWYSHEHPDHFSITDIKKINEKRKKKITILFQKTLDQKLAAFCKKMGFKIKELQLSKEYILEGGVKIICGSEGGLDSWLSINYNNKTVLNINDCRIETIKSLTSIKNLLGKIDVLMTQFSWANWTGNKGDKKTANTSRKITHKKNDNQIKILEPEFIIPFANFSWFSHEENYFCNDDFISIKEFIDRYPNKKKVIMYLGDKWKVGNNNRPNSIYRWEKEINKIKKPKHITKSVSIEELEDSFLHMQLKIKENNDWGGILNLYKDGLLEDCTINLSDIDRTVLFNIAKSGIKKVKIKTWDLQMTSESLNYVMRNAWGRGTLMINGKFQANYKTFYKFLRQTCIYYSNNIGRYFPKDINRKEIEKSKCFVCELLNCYE
jgi:UDP-MurNAc hydroxylase